MTTQSHNRSPLLNSITDPSTPQQIEEGVIIHHVEYSVLHCVCGEKLEWRHSCNSLISGIKVVACKDNCDFCKAAEKHRLYVDQWTVDGDGYLRCTYCGLKCMDSELPKSCDCDGYIDEEGVSRCKNCNHELYRVEDRCDNC